MLHSLGFLQDVHLELYGCGRASRPGFWGKPQTCPGIVANTSQMCGHVLLLWASSSVLVEKVNLCGKGEVMELQVHADGDHMMSTRENLRQVGHVIRETGSWVDDWWAESLGAQFQIGKSACDINALFVCRLVSLRWDQEEFFSGTFVPEIGYLAQIGAAIGCKHTSSCVEDIFDNQHRRGREQFLNTLKFRIIMCMNNKMSLDLQC